MGESSLTEAGLGRLVAAEARVRELEAALDAEQLRASTWEAEYRELEAERNRLATELTECLDAKDDWRRAEARIRELEEELGLLIWAIIAGDGYKHIPDASLKRARAALSTKEPCPDCGDGEFPNDAGDLELCRNPRHKEPSE